MSCFSCFFPKQNNSCDIKIQTGKDSNPQLEIKEEETIVDEAGRSCARSYCFRDLVFATGNFAVENLIGEGGFGKVYKGQLNSGSVVAVKKLNKEGVQGTKEFMTEILMLTMLRHPNLVNLYGYCIEGDDRLLVYEYMPQGSLEDHLFVYANSSGQVLKPIINCIAGLTRGKQPLEWDTRIKIALGVAEGLKYLHAADPPIIYRDMKAANVLLDDDFNPKLSDFGLAKIGPVGPHTHVSTRIMGTYGYCAPDYAYSGKLNVKSDVYSFGVMLLELMTGLKAFDSARIDVQRNLISWARPFLLDKRWNLQLADPLLQGRFPARSFCRLCAITKLCLSEHPHLRPGISDVVLGLGHVTSSSSNPNSSVNSSPSSSSSPSLQADAARSPKGRRGSRMGA